MDLKKTIGKISSKLGAEVEDKINLDKLFNKDFMKEHTKFKDWKEMFSISEIDTKEIKDIMDLPKEKLEKLNKTIKEKTDFSSWEDMLKKAMSFFSRD